MKNVLIKVASAEGRTLDYLAGIAQGWTTYPEDSIEQGQVFHKEIDKTPFGKILDFRMWNPTTDISDAWTIIEPYGISLFFVEATSDREDLPAFWNANMKSIKTPSIPDPSEGGMMCNFSDTNDSSALVAAMRCFVIATLGNKVEVPEIYL